MATLPSAESIRLAGVVERARESLLAALEGRVSFLMPDLAHSLATEWWEFQIQYLRKGTMPPLEWVISYVDGVRNAGSGIEEILTALQSVRNLFIQYCEAHAEGVSVAQIYEVALAMEDPFLRQIGHVYEEMDRKRGTADRRRNKAMAEWMERAFVLLDNEGGIVLANSFFCGMMGLAEDRVLGQSFASFCDSDTASRIRQVLRQKRAVATGPFEGVLVSHRGGRMLSRFWTLAMFDPDGRREGLAVAVTDAEGTGGNVVSRAKMLESLSSTLGIGCYVIDESLQVVSANAYAREYVQPGTADAGVYCCRQHVDENGTCGDCLRKRVFEQAEPFRATVQCRTLAGEMRWAEMTAVPLRGEHGIVTHVAKIIRDVTERKMLEDQILEQQRSSLASQLAITVAHQLRNPLGVIIGFAEMLTKGMPPEQTPMATDRILHNGLRCKEIVQALLEFGRGEPREYIHADMNAIIRERVQPAYAGPKNHRITWDLSDSPLPIECALDQIAQVLMNLVDNALWAASNRVRIRTVLENGQAVVLVQDDGPGVPALYRERIFDPFYTTRKESGSVGLGLCLSRAVVQEHQGSLALDNMEEPGACFVVRLPVAKEGRAEETDAVEPALPARTGRRVLIVEDETDLQFLLGMALESEGHEVDSAVTGAQAMELFLARKYDAVVIDMLLADELGGRDLYQYLLQTDPKLAGHALFVTGDMMNFQTRRFLSEVNRPYLEKPFLISDFTAHVEALFERPSGS